MLGALATFQALKSHIRIMAMALDSRGRKCTISSSQKVLFICSTALAWWKFSYLDLGGSYNGFQIWKNLPSCMLKIYTLYIFTYNSINNKYTFFKMTRRKHILSHPLSLYISEELHLNYEGLIIRTGQQLKRKMVGKSQERMAN